eukprot:135478-Pyramimonas_sp.AAC.1
MKAIAAPTVHAPQLHLTIIRPGNDQGQSGMESGPVHATIVTLENVLHHCVTASEQIAVHLLKH